MTKQNQNQTSFDPSKDGADRCEAFTTAFVALLREHKVEIRAVPQNLRLVTLEHDGEGPDTGWTLDMEDIHFLLN